MTMSAAISGHRARLQGPRVVASRSRREGLSPTHTGLGDVRTSGAERDGLSARLARR